MWNRKLFILGARVDPVTMAEALRHITKMVEQEFWEDKKQHYLVTLNPEIVLETLKDDSYRVIVGKASLSVPDGFGLKIAAVLFGEKIPERVTGVDLVINLCRLAAEKAWPIYLLGGLHQQSAQPATVKLKKMVPKLIIAGSEVGPSRQKLFDQDANKAIIERISQSGAKILLIGFGAPRQEQWIDKNLSKISNIKLAIGVGGSFEYLSGKVKRAPIWMRKMGLEWLYRLVKQPWRLPRVLNATLIFLATTFFWRIRMWTRFRPNVAGLILNKKNQVLLVSPARLKYYAWQFPQGGIDKGETADQAILREMTEEIGVDKDKFQILKKIPDLYRYVWPKWAQLAQGYKGQSQTLYILRFTAEDKDIDLSRDVELRAYKWIAPNKLLETIHQIRKPMAAKALKELAKLKL